jgi:hypothetical protein
MNSPNPPIPYPPRVWPDRTHKRKTAFSIDPLLGQQNRAASSVVFEANLCRSPAPEHYVMKGRKLERLDGERVEALYSEAL